MRIRPLLVRPGSITAAPVLAVGLLAAAAPASQASDTPVADSWVSIRSTYSTSAGPVSSGTRAVGVVQVVATGVRAYSTSLGGLLVQPPHGVFSAGTTSTLRVYADSNARPLLDPAQGELGYAGSPWCLYGTSAASLTVDAATYTAGALQSLAAAVDITCANGWPPVHVDLRLRSATPTRAVSMVVASLGQATPAPAGTVRDLKLFLANRSTVPLTVGDPVVGTVPAGWTVEATRGTCGATLAVGSTCSLAVHTVSGGTPMSVAVSVPTPDDPDVVASTVIATALTMGAPTLTTRTAFDGVGLSWRFSPLIPRPTGYLVERSTDGITWTTLATTGSTQYADTSIDPGATASYRVTALQTAPSSYAVPTSSAVVDGSRGATDPGADPAIDTGAGGVDWPSANGGGFPISSLVGRLPDGPGVYTLPNDVAFGATCRTQTGTLTVRDLVRRADGAVYRADADLSYRCDDGPTSVSRWLKGVDSLKEPLLTMTTPDLWYYPQYASQVDPARLRVVLTNVGTVPWTKSTSIATAAPAKSIAVSSTCPAVLAVGASCTITLRTTVNADWAGEVALVAHNAGVQGDVRAPFQLALRYDDSAPRRTSVPVNRFLSSQEWGFWPDDYDDFETGIASTDVRYRVSSGGSLSAWRYPAEGQHRDPTKVGAWSWTANPGEQVCLSSRARDRAGNVTFWSPQKCTYKLMDDSSSSEWTAGWVQRVGSDTFWDSGEFLHTTKRGSVMSSYAPMAGRRVALEVKTCPTCGSVNVYIGSTRVGTISTYSAKAAWHVVRELPAYPTLLRGKLRVVSTSTKPVFLDGWGVRLT